MTSRRLSALVLALLGTAALAACAGAPPASSALGLRSGQTGSMPSDDTIESSTGGSSVFGLYLAGDAAIDHGASREAAAYFGQASQLEPGLGPVRGRAFSSALVAGEVSRAAEAAQGLGDGDLPVQRLAILTRAVEAMAEDKNKQAYDLLAARNDSPEHAQAIKLLTPWAAAAAGDWTTATADPPAMGDPVAQGVAVLGQAELLERADKPKLAETVYKAHAGGKDGLFVLGYGGFLERHGRRSEAVGLYDRALAQNGADPAIQGARDRAAAGRTAPPLVAIREGAAQALVAPAAMMLARHEGDDGLAYLRLALRLDPGLDDGWVLVGDAMGGAGDLASAKEAYLKVRPKSDQYILARTRLAVMAQQAGDKEAALRLARDMLDASPNDPRALTVYGDLLRDDERYVEAAEAITRALKNSPDSDANWMLYFQRGSAEERAGQWPAAEADLKLALKLKPNEPEVLNYLGYAWADRGEHLKEALGMLEKAAELEPRSGAIVDSLGWARYRVHQYQDALRDLEHAVTLDPSDPEVNSHLGDVYWQVGRKLEARFQWKRVLTLDPDPKLKAGAELRLAQGLPVDAAASPAIADGAPRP